MTRAHFRARNCFSLNMLFGASLPIRITLNSKPGQFVEKFIGNIGVLAVRRSICLYQGYDIVAPEQLRNAMAAVEASQARTLEAEQTEANETVPALPEPQPQADSQTEVSHRVEQTLMQF
jgi:hypothetical protein